jgi:hypothetical protein
MPNVEISISFKSETADLHSFHCLPVQPQVEEKREPFFCFSTYERAQIPFVSACFNLQKSIVQQRKKAKVIENYFLFDIMYADRIKSKITDYVRSFMQIGESIILDRHGRKLTLLYLSLFG